MARGSEPIASRALAAVGWVFFVFCLVLTIYFHLQWQDAQQAERLANEELQEFILQAERDNPRIVEARERGGDQGLSVAGYLIQELAKANQLIGGTADTNRAAIVREMADMGIAEGTAMVNELRTLSAERDANLTQITNLQDQIAEGQRKLANLEREKTALSQQFDASVTELRDQLARVQAEYGDESTRQRDQIAAFEGRITQLQDQQQSELNRLRAEIDSRETEINLLRKRVQDFQTAIKSRTEEGDVRTLPDGKIAAILAEENLVYIDRGATDHIQPGMTFQVYNPDDAIKLQEPLEELEGKATIEVITISETASVARIVRQDRGKLVNEGDLIANIAYDPETVFKFYVHGDFDIDRTGTAKPSDRRRIETMVLEWGGTLADPSDEDDRTLSYDVDYLVLGIEPEVPEPLPSHVFDPELIEIYRKKLARYEEYKALVAEAKQLSIPVLNQNRFLALTGYYQR